MAFEGLSDKLSAAFKRLRSKGKLSEADVKEAMREVRLALLEAVMTARAAGGSVRATAQQMAQGDPALMMRLQNKYRALLRHHPEWVKEAGERLAARGVDFRWPGTMAEEKEDAPADRQLEETAQRLRQLQRRLQDESRELGAIAQQAERQAKRGRPGGGRSRQAAGKPHPPGGQAHRAKVYLPAPYGGFCDHVPADRGAVRLCIAVPGAGRAPAAGAPGGAGRPYDAGRAAKQLADGLSYPGH